VIFALLLPSIGAGATAELLEQAVDAYATALNTEARDLRLETFRRSERLFRRVAEDGIENPDLYTNLGNAALQAAHLGSAILAYRRALRIDPDHPRALQNLEFARKLLPEWIPRPAPAGLLDSFFFWHRTLSSAERSIAAAVSFAAAALLAAAGIRFGQPVLRNLAIVPGLLWLALLASLVLDPSTRAKDEAVIIADEVVARSADSAIAPSPFPGPLPGGVEVRILEERSPWVRVRLANGRDAWVSGSALSKVDVNG
jgi:tetratricopeptide (TPR) repeat protein